MSHADLVETKIGVELVRNGVRHAYLEQRHPCALLPCQIDQEFDDATAEPTALPVRMHTDVEHVAFTDGDRHDAVPDQAVRPLRYVTVITHTQAVAKNAEGPWKLVRRVLNLD